MGLADRAYLKRDYLFTGDHSFKPHSKRKSEAYNSDVMENITNLLRYLKWSWVEELLLAILLNMQISIRYIII